ANGTGWVPEAGPDPGVGALATEAEAFWAPTLFFSPDSSFSFSSGLTPDFARLAAVLLPAAAFPGAFESPALVSDRATTGSNIRVALTSRRCCTAGAESPPESPPESPETGASRIAPADWPRSTAAAAASACCSYSSPGRP